MVENKLNQLKEEIINYSSLVKKMFAKSVEGFQLKDESILNNVINELETKSNDKEIEIDDKAISIIAKYSPKASYLRSITVINKMNNDLERMADHCVKISYCTIDLIDIQPNFKNDIVDEIYLKVDTMLNNSIDSFINKDIRLAEKVCRDDLQINELKDNLIDELISHMNPLKNNIRPNMFLIDIIKNFERIGDLCTNISENVIYMINGSVIKHNSKYQIINH